MMKDGEFLIYNTDTFSTNITQTQDNHIQNIKNVLDKISI